MAPLRLVVADDHALVRQALRGVLNADPRFRVVAELALHEVTTSMPADADVAIVHADPRNDKAADIVRGLRSQSDARVLLFFRRSGRASESEILALGANGAVSEFSPLQQLVRAILAVVNDETYVADDVRPPWSRDASAAGARRPASALSPRQAEILNLIADGFTYKEIAATLAINVKTVHTYRARVADKLGLRSRADFVRYSREQRRQHEP